MIADVTIIQSRKARGGSYATDPGLRPSRLMSISKDQRCHQTGISGARAQEKRCGLDSAERIVVPSQYLDDLRLARDRARRDPFHLGAESRNGGLDCPGDLADDVELTGVVWKSFAADFE